MMSFLFGMCAINSFDNLFFSGTPSCGAAFSVHFLFQLEKWLVPLHPVFLDSVGKTLLRTRRRGSHISFARSPSRDRLSFALFPVRAD